MSYNITRHTNNPLSMNDQKEVKKLDVLEKVASSLENALDLFLGEDIQKRADKYIEQYLYFNTY